MRAPVLREGRDDPTNVPLAVGEHDRGQPRAGALTSTPTAEVFGPGGFLEQHSPGYVQRAGQRALTEGIDAAIQKPGTVLLAEAPTGTGKSLAYLVPAIWHAVHQKRRAVVVTANIALQEQLIKKDLPALRVALPWPFEFALAKGIGNYLCLRKFRAESGDAGMFGLGDAESDRQWSDVLRWAGTTELGDLSELPLEPLPKVRLAMTTSAEDCVGRKCQHHAECGAMKARAAWQRAQVVVTNYHLFFADMSVRAESAGEASLLPPHEVVICDEGHNAADIARGFLGFRVTPGAIRWAVRTLAPRGKDGFLIDKPLQQRVHDASERLFDELIALERSDRYAVRFKQSDQFAAGPLLVLLHDAAKALKTACETLPMPPDKAEDVRRGADRCLKLAGWISQAVQLAESREWVYFIEAAGKAVALCGKPIDVAPMLRDHLFNGTKTVVVTSATLTVKDSFDHVATDLGADVVDELAVDSPFDWAHRALLVVPEGLVPPNDPAFDRFAPNALQSIVEAARGRTLVLCTSYRMLQLFRDALRRPGACRYPVLVQGEAPRMELLRRFKEDVSSVLIGTDSFWEGVDVPGESLSCVVIDRIPFENAADPIVDAVTARTKAWFQKWMVPRAVISMRQGVGRLLRRAEDRGVVVVLDTRLIDKGYGKQFLKSLPAMRLSRDIASIREFLA